MTAVVTCAVVLLASMLVQAITGRPAVTACRTDPRPSGASRRSASDSEAPAGPLRLTPKPVEQAATQSGRSRHR
jgi:hypothetical protein